jgi:hypothetical protein
MKGAAAGTVKRSDAISLIRINFLRVPQRQGVPAYKGAFLVEMPVVRLRAVRGRKHGPFSMSLGAAMSIRKRCMW